MCGGGDNGRAEAEAEQAALNQQAAARQAQLDALAAQRSEIAAAQLVRKNEMEALAQSQIAAHTYKVQQLQAEQGFRLANMEAASEAEKAQVREAARVEVEGVERAGGAAATSLRILGQRQRMAPNAEQTPKKNRRRGAASTSANVARGSAQQRGSNLSI